MFTPTLYFDADGAVVRAILTEASLPFNTAPEDAAGAPLTFDATTNAALVVDLLQSTDSYRLTDGVLTKNDAPVMIQPPAVDQRAADTATIGTVLASLPDDQPLTKADLAPLLALFGAGAGQP